MQTCILISKIKKTAICFKQLELTTLVTQDSSGNFVHYRVFRTEIYSKVCSVKPTTGIQNDMCMIQNIR